MRERERERDEREREMSYSVTQVAYTIKKNRNTAWSVSNKI